MVDRKKQERQITWMIAGLSVLMVIHTVLFVMYEPRPVVGQPVLIQPLQSVGVVKEVIESCPPQFNVCVGDQCALYEKSDLSRVIEE